LHNQRNHEIAIGPPRFCLGILLSPPWIATRHGYDSGGATEPFLFRARNVTGVFDVTLFADVLFITSDGAARLTFVFCHNTPWLKFLGNAIGFLHVRGTLFMPIALVAFLISFTRIFSRWHSRHNGLTDFWDAHFASSRLIFPGARLVFPASSHARLSFTSFLHKNLLGSI
jgi:hypothetical protein